MPSAFRMGIITRKAFLKVKPIEENKKSPLPSAAVITQKLKENPPLIDLKQTETLLLTKVSTLSRESDILKPKLIAQENRINDVIAKPEFQGLTKEEQQVFFRN